MPAVRRRAAAAAKPPARAEEIELVFDRNKGASTRCTTRALRDNAELQGKLVLEFTIAPSGRGDHVPCRLERAE